MTEVAFKTLILGALEGLHGKLGSVGYPVDVLSWDPLKGEGRLRVNARYVVTTPSPTLHNPGETRLTHANRTFCVHRRSPYPCSGSRCEKPARRASRRLPKCPCCTGAYASTLPTSCGVSAVCGKVQSLTHSAAIAKNLLIRILTVANVRASVLFRRRP